MGCPLSSLPMPMKFDQSTFPDALNVVSLATAKNHLRVDHTDDDTLITSLISVAQDVVQKYTGTFLQRTDGVIRHDHFHDWMDLHVGVDVGLTSETNGVAYMGTHDREVKVSASDYQLDGEHYPARLRMTSIPTDVKDELNAVRIYLTCGYSADNRPPALVSAMLLIIGHLYENRQDVTRFKQYEIPMSSQYLMNPYRLKSF